MAIPRPLGLREDFDVGPAILEKLKAVEGFDFEPLNRDLITRVNPPFRPDELDEVKLDLRRVLSLPVIFPGMQIVPPARVDDAWHELILHTKRYAAFCKSTLDYFLHHDAASESTSPREELVADLSAGFNATRARYTEAYGPPPEWLWAGAQRWEAEPQSAAQRWLLNKATRLQERLSRQVVDLYSQRGN